ncbi:MAG: TonB-dependent receptor [Nibricoccus sp.]
MSFREVAHIGMAVLALCAATSVHSQNETSSALAGEVLNVAGGPLAGASVSLSHAPTGTTQQARTNASGRFAFSGLPPGGPYVLATSSFGYETHIVSAIHLDLGENRAPEITLRPDRSRPTEGHVQELDKLVVTASRAPATEGASTHLSRENLDNQPSVDRSINEYARNAPNVTIIDTERGELTGAGQNTRFNSTQIDGVRLDDMFGLTSNGMPSQGNPFSMETVEALSIDVSPYDAGRSGFTGASVNAVTRSGTNQFHGSLYYSYRNQNFRARHPITGERDPFTDQTAGLTFGGPVLRNRLFFFAGYEYSRRTEPAPSAGFDPAPAAPLNHHNCPQL